MKAQNANVYREEDHPDGLVCMGCDHVFSHGEIFSERLTHISGDGLPIVELVCIPCGLGLVEA